MGIFRRWVVHTFGVSALSKGAGVLDVAAGKGVLGFELRNVHGISCTVVDPRPLQLTRNAKLWGAGFYHKKSKLSTLADDNLIHYQPPAAADTLPHIPYHIRGFFEPALWEPLFVADGMGFDGGTASGSGEDTVSQKAAALFAANLKRAESTAWTKKGLSGARHEDESEMGLVVGEDARGSVREAMAVDVGEAVDYTNDCDTTVRSFETALEMLRDCSCVLGMHPDQAACPIVEFAVRAGKPFAVVPCCVYGAQINRRMSNGQRVKTYADLLDYLESLAPDIRRIQLPHLEGKNVCLYRTIQQDEPLSKMSSKMSR